MFAFTALMVLSIGMVSGVGNAFAITDETTRSGGVVTQTYGINEGTQKLYLGFMCGEIFWTETMADGNKIYEEWDGPTSMTCSGTTYNWDDGQYEVQEDDNDSNSDAYTSEIFTDADGTPSGCDSPTWSGCDNTETDNRVDPGDAFEVTVTWNFS